MMDVLIPTVHRADRLQPILDNVLDVAQIPTRVYFVAENNDEPTKAALRTLRGDHVAVMGRFGSCAKAMNAGYWAGEQCFVFTGNDDLLFHKGWDIAALARMDGTANIVGTNDGNGRMTCFAVARRAFIREHSGVFDRADTLYHPYLSQYVDTEFADYAKHRGAWAEAEDSLTEHLHWEFGKAERDHPNYAKARETCAEDARTYEARRAQWALA